MCGIINEHRRTNLYTKVEPGFPTIDLMLVNNFTNSYTTIQDVVAAVQQHTIFISHIEDFLQLYYNTICSGVVKKFP